MMRFGDKFKAAEVYSGLKVEPLYIVRLDGWHFKSFTKQMGYEKPYDHRLTGAFISTIQDFFSTFKPSVGYTFSDEVSFIFSKPTVFNRVEKLDSLFAGAFSSAFSLKVGRQAVFDSRIIPVKSVDDIMGYLTWRQFECKRNFINGYAEHVLRESGLSPAVVAKRMKGMNGKQLEAFCKEKGLDLNMTILRPQRQGLLFYSETFTKDAFNVKTQQPVKAVRRRVAMMSAPVFSSAANKQPVQTLLKRWLAAPTDLDEFQLPIVDDAVEANQS